MNSVKIIIPTSINLLTAINENFVRQKKAGQPTEIELPSLRRRALLAVNEIGTVPIEEITDSSSSPVRGS